MTTPWQISDPGSIKSPAVCDAQIQKVEMLTSPVLITVTDNFFLSANTIQVIEA